MLESPIKGNKNEGWVEDRISVDAIDMRWINHLMVAEVDIMLTKITTVSCNGRNGKYIGYDISIDGTTYIATFCKGEKKIERVGDRVFMLTWDISILLLLSSKLRFTVLDVDIMVYVINTRS